MEVELLPWKQAEVSTAIDGNSLEVDPKTK